MIHQQVHNEEDNFQNINNYQIGYDEENQNELNDEYPDTQQIQPQSNQAQKSLQGQQSARKSSASTNNTNQENNISINLNDNQNSTHTTQQQQAQNQFEISIGQKKYKRYMGHTIGFINIKGEPIFTLGPHFCIFLVTWCIMTGFSYFLVFKVSKNKGDFWYYLTMLVCGGQSLSYLLTALINPGIHTARCEGQSNKRLQNYCQKCDINQTKQEYHCPDCDVCIKDFDHHCPWTGKCIGGGNMMLFQAFISFTIFWFFYSLVMLLS
ncbi:DHHC zinc finger protein (macronuclear) [Tetrahymena thermophila SB210]|uniref:Palmitoyltransferase n=1 Tax=Tetrahymena thermophila (strain SB210) TaxID=312017 RepID=Q23QA5_TETTS|nr:DHHC zinc finger protein [Tetrahymena thermophila SB210]EAR98679.4 DHHC zinc finger protein [Tetrahymena thermophila SB210]|eukprot:XP_001018924.4 DHHC zinc finger protein [Tetrahymena thermophila SB210]